MEEEVNSHWWKYSEKPVLVMIVYSLIVLAYPLTNLLSTKINSIISWGITIFVFGFISYLVLQDKKAPKDLFFSGKIGLYAGALIGFISAVLGIISYYLFPQRILDQLAQLTAASGTQISSAMIQIGLYAGLVIGPISTAIIGGIISLVATLILRKILNK
jgi:magnesium-transporting ATPase (P-type)